MSERVPASPSTVATAAAPAVGASAASGAASRAASGAASEAASGTVSGAPAEAGWAGPASGRPAARPAEPGARAATDAWRADVDGLRAVAVLLVVAYHLLPETVRGGFVGVDVFFVISGYLITSLLLRDLSEGRFSIADFYARRVRRIVPALAVVCAAALAIGWAVMLPGELERLGLHLIGGATFSSNLVLWAESGYFDAGAGTKPLLHLWSLAIEEQFYLVWPLVLAWAWRRGAGLGRTIGVLAAVSFAAGLVLARVAPDAGFYLPVSRGWELLAGAALAWHATVRPPGPARAATARAWLGVALLAAAVATIRPTEAFPGAWALLPVLGAALLIGAGPAAWPNRVLLSNRLAAGLGRISYPLYLWHWLLLSMLAITEQGAAPLRLRAGAVVLSFALAWLPWRRVERPVRARADTGRTAVALAAALGVVALAGALAWRGALPPLERPAADIEQRIAAFEWTEADNRDDACVRRHPGHRFCRIAEDAQPTAALVGDSHSNHFFPGLAASLRARGENLLLLGRPHCPPLLDITSGYLGQIDWCEGETSRSLRAVAADPAIRTVYLAGNWHLYVVGTRFHRHHRFSPPWRIAPLGAVRDTSTDGAAVLVDRLGATIGLLEAAGKHVVVLRQIPELSFEPRHCAVPRPASFSALDPRACEGVPREEALRYLSGYAPAMDAVLRAHPGVEAWDPAEVLCDTPRCRYVEEGLTLYQDDLHLSRHGSAWVAEAMLRRYRPPESKATDAAGTPKR
jgi:peptidoglycan/LPS O-acetylase OafA/YrhL